MNYRVKYNELFHTRQNIEEEIRQRQSNLQYEMDCLRKLEIQLQKNESDINDLIVDLMEENEENERTIDRMEVEYDDLKHYGGKPH